MNRALKLSSFCLLSLMVLRYVPVYYHTTLFNQFVQDQVPRIRLQQPLQEAILSKAEEHNLNVSAEDISMTTNDSVLRVAVQYQVPVNFFVFKQHLKFNAAGSGFLMRGH